MSNQNNNQVQRMLLTKLKPNPKQGDIYEQLPEAELRALANSMRSDGQRQPVEIMPAKNRAGLPAGTIIDGHNRVAAARLLGWTHIDVVIRHDLVDVDADTVQGEYISANLRRRQLQTVDKAAAALCAYELKIHKSGFDDMDYREIAEAYALIGAAADCSGRHLSRLINLLRTPRPIQRAVRDKLLPIVRADRISRLPQVEQEQIADEIRSISDKKKIESVVNRHLGALTVKHHKVGDAFASFIRGVEKGLADLTGREQVMSTRLLESHRNILEIAQKQIGEWLARLATSKCDIVSAPECIAPNSVIGGPDPSGLT